MGATQWNSELPTVGDGFCIMSYTKICRFLKTAQHMPYVKEKPKQVVQIVLYLQRERERHGKRERFLFEQILNLQCVLKLPIYILVSLPYLSLSLQIFSSFASSEDLGVPSISHKGIIHFIICFLLLLIMLHMLCYWFNLILLWWLKLDQSCWLFPFSWVPI